MDDTDGDGGDCDDDMTGPRDVVGTIDDDDDVGAMDDCVELICHNGDSGFFNKQTKKKRIFQNRIFTRNRQIIILLRGRIKKNFYAHFSCNIIIES